MKLINESCFNPMKYRFFYRFLSLLTFLLMIPSFLNGEIVRKTYHFSAPKLTEQADGSVLIDFGTSYQMGREGEPSIPVQKIALLLPPGHIASDIQVDFKAPMALPENLHLAPKKRPRPMGPISFGSKEENINPNIFKTMGDSLNEGVKTHFLFGHSVALGVISPLQYLPATQDLNYFSEITVTVSTTPDFHAVQALQLYRNDDLTKNRLRHVVDNYDEMIDNYPEQENPHSYDYLIITIEEFKSDYQLLANFYNVRGLKTKIQTVEWIYENILGNDEPEKIRNYIIEEARDKGILYVLLAGDADASSMGQMQVPIRYFYAEVLSGGQVYKEHIPTDLYYSALDGNWNTDKDEFWGEPGEDDLLPELYVGRIPADSHEEIRAIILKIINYQQHPISQDSRKVLLAGQHLWDDPLSFGADYLEMLIGYKEDNGYKTYGIPEDMTIFKLYDKDLYPGHWSKSDLLDYISRGVNFIFHLGHSNSRSVMSLSLDDIRNENFSDVDGKNHLNPIVYSQGCNAAKLDGVSFDGSDCIAEKMLEIENFAVAFIGNTRYGWFNEGQTEGPSLHLQREFLDALYHDGIYSLGGAHAESRSQSAPFVTAPDQWEPGALRWCFYGANVFGDPAMAAWTDEIQQFASVDIQHEANGTFAIHTNVPGATIALSADSVLLAVTKTDSSGFAVIAIDSSYNGDELLLCATAQNYAPLFETISSSPLPTSVTDSKTNISTFELRDAYPNPFNPATTIQFALTKPGFVKLTIYNIRGQEVKTLLAQNMNPGTHRAVWNGKDNLDQPVPSGVYFYRLSAPEGNLTKSCILIK